MSQTITAVGYLAGPPELRRPSGNGTHWCAAAILVTDRIQDRATGQWSDAATTRYDVAVFGADADALSQACYTNGNIRVRFSGRLTTKLITTKDNETRLVHDVKADWITPTFRQELTLRKYPDAAGLAAESPAPTWAQPAQQESDPWPTPAQSGAKLPGPARY